MGEVCRPWILDFVGSVFGAYDPEAGRRLITEFFLLISKKNGKSTTAAGIMLTALIRNWRESAEFLILAPTVEIANNSFYPARDMVRKNPVLSDLLHVQEHYRTIIHRGNGATLKVVAADSETVGGKKATGVLVDELWLFGKQPNAENMLREATGGLASRPEGFTIYLSTQSDQPPAGIFRDKLQYARAVRDGAVEDKRFLPVLYEFPPAMVKSGAPPLDKWFITNPNLGASVDPEFLAHKLQEAEHAGKASLCGFYAKHANIEIGLALMSDRWSGADYWEGQGRPAFTLDELLARSEVVDVGIDGGGLDDLLGLCVLGRMTGGGEWWVWAHAWAHPSVLERRKSEAPRLRDFAKQGNLTLVQKIGDDTAQVAGLVKKCEDSGKLDKVGVDPSGLGTILDEIVKAGVPKEKVVGIAQGWKMYGAILTAERKLAEGALVHGAQPLMAWCVGNAKIEPRGNAAIITKQASGRAKIDPVLAMLNSVTLMSLNPEAPGKIQVMFV
jgi:phage terminase large subunit-like protein